MLKCSWIVGSFKFHCVQCWDKLPYSLKFKCWDLSGTVVNIIIPWGKPMISEEFTEGVFCHFPPGRVLRISWGCSHPAGGHLCNTKCSHILGTPRCNSTCWELLWVWGEDMAQLWVLWTHLGGLQTLLSCSSPESPSCHVPGPALCPWCHVGHWKKVKTLPYGALKANHFLLRHWRALEIFRIFLRL